MTTPPRTVRIPSSLFVLLLIGLPLRTTAGSSDVNLNLTLTPASYSGCDDPAFVAIDEGDCGDLASAPIEGPAFVWVVAGVGDGSLAGLQFGAVHDAAVEGWTLCTGGLEIPENGWPASGTGIAVTWSDDCYDPPGEVARVGYFRVPDGSAGTVALTADPRIEATLWSSCTGEDIPICPGLLGAADLSVGTIPLCGPASAEVPSVPTSVTATTGECPVGITWEHDGEDVTGFLVLRDGIGFAEVPSNVREVVDPDASRETARAYTVVARNVCGDSPPSSAASGGAPPLPAATDLAIENRCDGPLLGWTDASDGEDGFHVVRNGEIAATVGANETTYLDEGGSPGFAYTYEVVAFDGCGDAAPSGSVEGMKLPGPIGPTGLTASDERCDVIRVTWTDRADDETGYDVIRDDELVASLPPGTEVYDDADADPWVPYQYRIVTHNACGSLTTGYVGGYRGGPPGAVTDLSAAALCGTVRLRWAFHARPNATLTVHRDGELLAELPHQASTYDDSTAVAGVGYTYVVQGHNECGDGTAAEIEGMSTDAPPPPVASVTATDDRCDGVLVTWADDREDETGFRVLRDAEEVAVLGPDETEYLDTGMTPNQSYAYTVLVTTDCGEADPSDPAPGSWYVPDLLPAPELLGPVQEGLCIQGPLDFRWTSVPGANRYRLRVGSDCGLDDLLVLEPTDTTVATGAIPSGHVHWQVEARNECGAWGEASACSELDVMAPLPAPTILTGDRGDHPEDGLWNVSWEPVLDADRYVLSLSYSCHEDGPVHDLVRMTVAGTDTTLDVKSYEHPLWGIEFWAWVSAEACGALGDSTSCIGPGCCSNPVLLEAFEGHAHDDGIELTWRTGGDRATDGFDLWRRDDHDAVLRRVTPDPVDGNAYLDRSARPGRTYTYELREVVPGEDGVVLGHTTVRWAALPAGVTLRSTPNPFNPRTTLHVELDRSARVVLEVYDATGRMVRPLMASTLSPGHHRVVWDGRDAGGHALPSGIYYARLRADGVIRIERLALVR